nr:hypothetical protein [Nostoc sp. CreGUA01]
KELQFLAGHRFHVKLTPMGSAVPLQVYLSRSGNAIDELQLSSPNHHLVFSPQYQGSSSDNNQF